MHLSISNGLVSSKIYDTCKRDDFDFDLVNFPFLDGDVPRSTSYGVYISQLIRFARISSHVADFNARNISLTAKLLQQGYRYHKPRKKRPRGRAVSAPDFGSRGRGFESRWRRDSSRT